ncbi:PadR family transcriptional regulator [Longirhabdus pacifica]|uniref:PadR family transcriptional regulator n=1 Tax=Longirhabdus pacifica TaxID=2305227 RepID=UPI001008BD47|nr:helix-turn-helix transcriptional regulator [Longirhabdus pacifica]
MPRKHDPVEKESTLGHLIKVQQVIDFVVLSELKSGKQFYVSELDQKIAEALGGVGVNDSYLSARLKKLYENGHVVREWKGDDRYNRYYQITEDGQAYLNMMLDDIAERAKLAQKVYSNFEKYINQA